MKKRICVVTSSRADYGILTELLKKINLTKNFDLQLVVTGSHFSKNHGMTYKLIEKDKFKIFKKININTKNDDVINITKSFSVAINKFSKYLKIHKPHIVIVVGDRYEIFAVSIASMLNRTPLAHIHGGELTYGAIDDAIRHSITKIANYHFVSNTIYKKRVIQLGENSKNIHVVGALGIENLKKIKLMNKITFEKSLKIKLNKKNLLICFHPVTLEPGSSKKYMIEIFKALLKLKDTSIIFTCPNTDMESIQISEMIYNFQKNKQNIFFIKNLGTIKYFSAIKFVDCVIGNSSSGIIEVPSFKKYTINLGDRQKGRIQAKSILNCKINEKNITNAIKKVYFFYKKNKFPKIINPYYKFNSSSKVNQILIKILKNKIEIKKAFNDL